MRISDWSSDVCSSDLAVLEFTGLARTDGATPALPLDGLTKRERAVLGLLCEGRSNAQIAWQLGVAEKTARNHVSNLFRKLGVCSRAQAIVLAREATRARSEEHTSALQSLMRISSAVFCLTKKQTS